MIVVNQQDLAQTTTTTAQVPQQRIITQQIPSNGNVVESKPTTITNASSNARLTHQQVITPMGPLTLTADEYNELMQRRIQKQAFNDEVQRKVQQDANERAQQEANQRAQQEAHNRAAQQLQEHQNIAVQVQKIVQSLEEDIGENSNKKDDEDIEMQMIVPKMETDSVQGEEGTSSDSKTKSETAVVDKNAGRPFACDKCGKKFLLKHHLTTHARVHSGNLLANFKRFI